MSLPLFFPIPRPVPQVASTGPTLREWCASAGVPCRATGRWTERRLAARPDEIGFIDYEPGDGSVELGVPARFARSPQQLARYVLGAAAFALFDHVARESIRGALWARVENPRGPKFSGTALSARERQAKRRARLRQTVSAPI